MKWSPTLNSAKLSHCYSLLTQQSDSEKIAVLKGSNILKDTDTQLTQMCSVGDSKYCSFQGQMMLKDRNTMPTFLNKMLYDYQIKIWQDKILQLLLQQRQNGSKWLLLLSDASMPEHMPVACGIHKSMKTPFIFNFIKKCIEFLFWHGVKPDQCLYLLLYWETGKINQSCWLTVGLFQLFYIGVTMVGFTT